MIRRILVPTDGSDHAGRAVEFASDVGLKCDARIHILHVINRSKIPNGFSEYVKAEGIGEAPEVFLSHRIGDRILMDAERAVRRNGLKNVELEILRGDPATRIIESAREKDIDMIVMGARGLGAPEGIFLGSVSHKVSYLTHCPCTTVR
jgi:nucleotide-binding universal stress UspA family protein